MSAIASQITSLTIVYSTLYSGTDQRKHQSSVSLAIAQGIQRWPVNFLHKWPVTRKMFPFDDIIMSIRDPQDGGCVLNLPILRRFEVPFLSKLLLKYCQRCFFESSIAMKTLAACCSRSLELQKDKWELWWWSAASQTIRNTSVILCQVSIYDKTSYRKISWILEAARLIV